MDSTKIVPPNIVSSSEKRSAILPTPPVAGRAAASPEKAQAEGEDRRRSQRVLLRVRARVHLALQGIPTTFEVMTLNVNVHGALVVMLQSPTGRYARGAGTFRHAGTDGLQSCSSSSRNTRRFPYRPRIRFARASILEDCVSAEQLAPRRFLANVSRR
jgi:hypothetical protein